MGIPTPARSREDPFLRPSLGRILEETMAKCTGCGACREGCGFLRKYGAPGEIAQAYDPLDAKRSSIAFECSLCRLCDAVCPAGLKPRDLFMEMRREAFERGHGSFPEHKGLLAYERTGMSRRFTWYGLPEGCRTVLFPGCSFPGTRPGRTRELFRRLQEKDPRLGIVLDCCGRISDSLGREGFARAMMEEMSTYLKEQGVREVVTLCPNCHGMFERYAKGIEVRTVYEILHKDSFASFQRNGKVVLHDPCSVRFHASCQASVRGLLATAGIEAEDGVHSRKETLCCGSGAGVCKLSPGLADGFLERISKEAQGRTIATYCAGCADRLATRSRAVHVLDVLSEPSASLAGRAPVSNPPFTYLNRLFLKRHFRKTVQVSASRERAFTAKGEDRKGSAARILFLAALAAAVAALHVTGVTGTLDRETLQGFLERYGTLAPVIYIAVYTIAPALLLPGLPITLAGGILFGPLWGVVYTIIGSTMGACLAFLISRYAARGWVEDRLRSPRWRKLDDGVERHGWKVVAFTRLIPLFPFNLLNYAFGLTKIGFVPYAAATFICMLPACIAFIVFSSSLLDLLQGRFSLSLLIGLILIVLVSMIPVAYRIHHRRKGGPDLV